MASGTKIISNHSCSVSCRSRGSCGITIAEMEAGIKGMSERTLGVPDPLPHPLTYFITSWPFPVSSCICPTKTSGKSTLTWIQVCSLHVEATTSRKASGQVSFLDKGSKQSEDKVPRKSIGGRRIEWGR